MRHAFAVATAPQFIRVVVNHAGEYCNRAENHPREERQNVAHTLSGDGFAVSAAGQQFGHGFVVLESSQQQAGTMFGSPHWSIESAQSSQDLGLLTVSPVRVG